MSEKHYTISKLNWTWDGSRYEAKVSYSPFRHYKVTKEEYEDGTVGYKYYYPTSDMSERCDSFSQGRNICDSIHYHIMLGHLMPVEEE